MHMFLFSLFIIALYVFVSVLVLSACLCVITTDPLVLIEIIIGQSEHMSVAHVYSST